MQEQVSEVRARLDSIERHVAECRAAVQVVEDGDATAIHDLGGEVDAMAEDVAMLRAGLGAVPPPA